MKGKLASLLVLLGISAMAAAQGTQTATLFPGTDIGAQINNAQTALPARGGEVYVPSADGCYDFSTNIVLRTGVSLRGDSMVATCLRYTGSTGAAITLNSGSNLYSFQITGPNTVGQSNTGILIAGNHLAIEDVFVGDGTVPSNAGEGYFSKGVTFGNYSYIVNWRNPQIHYNKQNIVWPTGLTDAGEKINFYGGTIADGQNSGAINCVQIGTVGQLAGASFSFFGTSFDGCQVVNNEGLLSIFGGHFEDTGSLRNAPFVVTQSTHIEGNRSNQATNISGSDVVYDASATTANGVFQVDGWGNLFASQIALHGNPPVPLFYFGGTAQPSLTFYDSSSELRGGALYSIASGSNPVLNIQD